MLRKFALLTLCLAQTILLAANPPPLSPEWEEFVDSHQRNNVARRAPIPESERGTVKLYTFDVPVEAVEVTKSEYLNKDDAPFLFDPKRPKRAEVIVLPDKEHPLEMFIEKFGKRPKQNLWARKIQGHASYFAWAAGRGPAVLKFKSVMSNGLAANSSQMARIAVHQSDYLEYVLSETEMRHRPIGFFPERAAINFSLGREDYATVYRSLNAVGFQHDFRTMRMRSIHAAVADHAFLEEMAKLAGETVEARFENDYLPFVAERIAELMYIAGVIPAGHTQNMVG